MTWQVVWSVRAKRDLAGLPRDVQHRIITSVGRFATVGSGDVRKLQGMQDEWRLRVGSYRVRFSYEPEDSILVIRVLHRGQAYRD